MGGCHSDRNKEDISGDPHIGKPIHIERQSDAHSYSNKDHFIPTFTTKTSTVVYGYISLQFKENKINQIIPIELIEIIYKYIKNNCTFIIIFENNNVNHSYLHEIDIESGTNKNLSIQYDHSDHIWERVWSASYCYGAYNDETAIYRIGGNKDSIACILRTGKVITMPKIQRAFAQTVYCKNHGLFVIGGSTKPTDNDMNATAWYNRCSDAALKDMIHFNEIDNKWEIGVMPSMTTARSGHLCVFYDSHHYDISDKIFCLGGECGYGGGIGTECYDFSKRNWEIIGKYNPKMNNSLFGGCIDIQTDTLIIAGGIKNCCKTVQEYNLVKNDLFQYKKIGDFTNFAHTFYPKVTKHNQVVVVFGNNGYSQNRKDYGYVEYFDQRTPDNKWIVLSSLREMLEFTGSQVRSGFYQHMVQM